MTVKNNSDFLFLFDATNTNPNGDPEEENRPRMDTDTKTLLVSDSRRKRDIRDFLENKGFDIFVGPVNGTKVTMEKKFDVVMEKLGVDKKAESAVKERAILDSMADIRMFGSAMAVGGVTKTFTGPIQITWGYSLHPVDLVKSSSIVTIMNDDNSTFGKMFKAHYALVAHSGTVNKFSAEKTGLKDSDLELFRKALVQSMMNNQTHSKQDQQPLLYLEVEYAEGFDGYLGDLRRFLKTESTGTGSVRGLSDLSVDFEELGTAIDQMKEQGYVKSVRFWKSPLAKNLMNLPDGEVLDLLSPIVK